MLDALTEVAFEPEFAPSRIEKERKAVVAEAQVGEGKDMRWAAAGGQLCRGTLLLAPAVLTCLLT